MLGSGFPDAIHASVKLLPSRTVAVVLDISTDGATEINDKVIDKNLPTIQYSFITTTVFSFRLHDMELIKD